MQKIELDLKKYRNPKGYRGKSKIFVMIWYLVSRIVFNFSPRPANRFRCFILRMFGAKIGSSVLIRPSVKIEYPWKLIIEDHCWIGDCVTIYNQGQVKIRDNTVISQNCYICTGTHDWIKNSFDLRIKNVSIGRSVWIAADTFIGPGVNIGNNVLVGCRKTIMSSVLDGTILK